MILKITETSQTGCTRSLLSGRVIKKGWSDFISQPEAVIVRGRLKAGIALRWEATKESFP